MVDNTNPIRQFHPYQPVRDVPAAQRPPAGFRGMFNGSAGKLRDWGRANPGMLLGGLAGMAIGLGLMRRMR